MLEVHLSKEQKMGLALELNTIITRMNRIYYELELEQPDKVILFEDDFDFIIQLRPFFQNDQAKDATDIIENYLTD